MGRTGGPRLLGLLSPSSPSSGHQGPWGLRQNRSKQYMVDTQDRKWQKEPIGTGQWEKVTNIASQVISGDLEDRGETITLGGTRGAKRAHFCRPRPGSVEWSSPSLMAQEPPCPGSGVWLRQECPCSSFSRFPLAWLLPLLSASSAAGLLFLSPCQLRPMSFIAQCPTGQLEARASDSEVWVPSMLLTIGSASAYRGVYSPKFKDQCPVLISTLEYGGLLGTARQLVSCLIPGAILKAA